ncbi:hypothetical protein OH76DRAFT_137511 [Lentinus brumalis]|uniref:Uncharacterized protein n=1 Tax=Lentinus brumalis TaxID=2498619 RepID=A0A371CPP9_9APHY|nr:hypothetical protein OH76DRAFT_137511 [Polyporus brumalis]
MSRLRALYIKVADLVTFVIFMYSLWLFFCSANGSSKAVGLFVPFVPIYPPFYIIPLLQLALAMLSVFINTHRLKTPFQRKFAHCVLYLLWSIMPMIVRTLWGGLAVEQTVSHILEQAMLSFTFVVVNAHCRDDGLESAGLYGKVMTAVIEFLSAGDKRTREVEKKGKDRVDDVVDDLPKNGGNGPASW